eukprot:Gb_30580 [translate_table: standard]
MDDPPQFLVLQYIKVKNLSNGAFNPVQCVAPLFKSRSTEVCIYVEEEELPKDGSSKNRRVDEDADESKEKGSKMEEAVTSTTLWDLHLIFVQHIEFIIPEDIVKGAMSRFAMEMAGPMGQRIWLVAWELPPSSPQCHGQGAVQGSLQSLLCHISEALTWRHSGPTPNEEVEHGIRPLTRT